MCKRPTKQRSKHRILTDAVAGFSTAGPEVMLRVYVAGRTRVLDWEQLVELGDQIERLLEAANCDGLVTVGPPEQLGKPKWGN